MLLGLARFPVEFGYGYYLRYLRLVLRLERLVFILVSARGLVNDVGGLSRVRGI